MSSSRAFWRQYGPYLALVVALAATLGSLYYSEIAHFAPCVLCWYQRICMYPLVAILLVGIVRQDDAVADYVLPLSIVGLGVSVYHNLIERGVLPETRACAVGVPCDLRYVNYLGFITIPLMALTAFVLVTAIMLIVKRAGGGAAEEEL